VGSENTLHARLLVCHCVEETGGEGQAVAPSRGVDRDVHGERIRVNRHQRGVGGGGRLGPHGGGDGMGAGGSEGGGWGGGEYGGRRGYPSHA
jgi:hypothetical protein